MLDLCDIFYTLLHDNAYANNNIHKEIFIGIDLISICFEDYLGCLCQIIVQGICIKYEVIWIETIKLYFTGMCCEYIEHEILIKIQLKQWYT